MLANATLVNETTLTFTSTNSINQQGTVINDGIIDLQANVGLAGNGTLTNNVTIQKTGGAGTSNMTVATTNSGLIDVQTGTMQFGTSVTHTGGELRLTSGDVLITGGFHTFDATSSITDPGLDNDLTVQTLGTTLTMNGAYTVGGTTTVTSGIANFNVDANFPVLTTTGTVNLNLAGNTYTADTVNLNFGTLTVTDATSSLDIGTAFGWDGGSLGGAGTFNLLNTSLSQITGFTTKRLLTGTTLANDSLLGVSSTDSTDLDGTLINTGAIGFTSNAGFTGSGTFTNAVGGFTTKTAGGGTSTISTATVTSNAGTFQVQSDTLEIDNLTDSSGTITVDAGTIFRTSGNLTSTGLIQGEGTVDITTLFNQGNLNPGTSPGIIIIDGDADFTGGTLNFEVDGLTPGTEHDQIQVTGTATLGGTIVVTAGFAPAEDDTFDLITCGTACNGSFDTETLPADFSLANLGGIVQLTFATCAGTICWDNTSGDDSWTTLTNWNTDVLPVAGDDVVIDLRGGTTVTLDSGSQSILSLLSEEDLVISGGTLNISNTSTINGALTVSAGALNMNNTLVAAGGVTWSGGNFGGAGTGVLQIPVATTLTKSGGTQSIFNITLDNQGTFQHNSGLLQLVDATIDNSGDYDIALDESISDAGGSPMFNHTGTLTKTAGANAFTIGVPFNSTNATIDIQSGRVELTDGGTFDGIQTLSGVGPLRPTLGTFTVLDGVDFSGGVLSQTGGIVNALGGFSADTYSLSGVGTLNIDTAGGGSVGDTMVVDTFFNWLNNPNIGGSSTGVLQIPGGVTMTKAGGTQSIFNITLDNQGTFQHNSGLLQLVDATIDNSGDYDIAIDESITDVGGTPAFNHTGTLTKTAGANAFTIGVPFNSTNATIDIQSGRVELTDGGTFDGIQTLSGVGPLRPTLALLPYLMGLISVAVC